mgnify:FL=1
MNRNNTFNAFKIASTAIISTVIFNSCSPDIENKKNNDIIKVDPFQQNIKIARSINLGNALDAPNEGEWGVTLNNEYFKIIKSQYFSQ